MVWCICCRLYSQHMSFSQELYLNISFSSSWLPSHQQTVCLICTVHFKLTITHYIHICELHIYLPLLLFISYTYVLSQVMVSNNCWLDINFCKIFIQKTISEDGIPFLKWGISILDTTMGMESLKLFSFSLLMCLKMKVRVANHCIFVCILHYNQFADVHKTQYEDQEATQHLYLHIHYHQHICMMVMWT
jgi:hypothetical protein